MLFTPNYAVSYKGRFYQAGEQFEIAENDAAEMSRHGTVQQLPPEEPEQEMPVLEEPQEIAEPPQEASKRGRGRKGAEQ